MAALTSLDQNRMAIGVEAQRYLRVAPLSMHTAMDGPDLDLGRGLQFALRCEAPVAPETFAIVSMQPHQAPADNGLVTAQLRKVRMLVDIRAFQADRGEKTL